MDRRRTPTLTLRRRAQAGQGRDTPAQGVNRRLPEAELQRAVGSQVTGDLRDQGSLRRTSTGMEIVTWADDGGAKALIRRSASTRSCRR